MRIIMHVDMDAFYASVELRRRPELRGTPVLVGGSPRGVVLSATYEARALGVRSGMSTTSAHRLVPGATVISPDFRAYTEVSEAIVAIFESVCSVVESASIDEAYLDLSGAVAQLGSPTSIGEWIRATVADEQQITCSVGIGPTKFIAKVASQSAKPDGLREVPPNGIVDFLHSLPVEKMWGVGASTTKKLHRLGLFTAGDLAHAPKEMLRGPFGPHQGAMLIDLAWGRDPRRVVEHPRERSIGSQETFAVDSDDPEVIKRELLRMSAKTAARLRKKSLLARTITMSVRFADFSNLTRSATFTSPTAGTDEIHAQAVALYERLRLRRVQIRRVGVRAAGLVPAAAMPRQPQLTDPEHGWHEAEQAVDAAVKKFGSAAVQRASLTRRSHA